MLSRANTGYKHDPHWTHKQTHTNIENGEEFPSVVDVFRRLVLEQETEQVGMETLNVFKMDVRT